MKKNGKINSPKNTKVPQNAESLKGKSKNKPDETNLLENEEYHFSSSLNEELNELLEKDSKRFFGGCGG